jgi:spoIIIJ-associated protein
MSYIDVTGKTEDEAIRKALAQLGMDRDDVSVEILERAKSGFLGLGGNPARVRVTYADPEEEKVESVTEIPAPVAEPAKKQSGEKKQEKKPEKKAEKKAEKPAAKQEVKVEAKVESVEYSETIDIVAVCVPRILGQIKDYIENYSEPKEDWEL